MSKIACAMATLGVVAGLGVAAMPLASYAEDSGNVLVSATVNSNIQISTNTSEVNFGTLKTGDFASRPLTVTVTTSGGTGYTLSARTAEPDGAMTSSKSDTIPAIKAVSNAFDADGTNGGWGIATANGAEAQKWYGLNSNNTIINTAETGSATGDLTSVLFGIEIGSGTADGTYTANVTFTATANQ